MKDRLKRNLLPDFSDEINGRRQTLCYHNADGVYPNWPVFLRTISESSIAKQKNSAGAQEAFRKDVEREFGVLISRWLILQRPCHFLDREIKATVMKPSIIMHNMIAELRRDSYSSEMWSLGMSAM